VLVLTRKSQEAVVVGNSSALEELLKVTVLKVRGRRVTLGIEADESLSIQRFEIWERRRAKTRRKAAACP
jgi:carbon storage regulator CsrA